MNVQEKPDFFLEGYLFPLRVGEEKWSSPGLSAINPNQDCWKKCSYQSGTKCRWWTFKKCTDFILDVVRKTESFVLERTLQRMPGDPCSVL